MRWRGVAAEALLDLLAQRLRTALGVVILAGLVVLVLVVHGRAVGSQQDLEAMLDDPASRVLRLSGAQNNVAIDPGVVRATAGFAHVSETFALSSPRTVRSRRVPQRSALLRWVSDLPSGALPAGATIGCGEGLALEGARNGLGLRDGVGAVLSDDIPMSVAASGTTPAGLELLDRTVLVVPCDTETEFGDLVVITTSSDAVPAVADAVLALFSPQDRGNLQLESQSASIDRARGVAEAANRTAHNTSVIAALAASLATGLLLAFMVVQRRRDYGRRRAIGATRGAVVVIIVAQAWLTMLAALAVAFAATAALGAAGWVPVATPGFLAGLTIMLLSGAPIGGVVAGLIAATRDPLREIRVP